MARPSTIDADRILEVARRLFLARGHEVTTAEIAKEAGISEGSIYNRYPSKQDLFFAAMCFDQPLWSEGVVELAGSATVVENLTRFIRDGIAFFEKMMPRMMLVWSRRDCANPVEAHQRHVGAAPKTALERMTRYFEVERRLGRVETANDEVAARMLLAASANFAFFKTLGVGVRDALDAEAYAREVIRTLWRGIQPRPSGTSPRRGGGPRTSTVSERQDEPQ